MRLLWIELFLSVLICFCASKPLGVSRLRATHVDQEDDKFDLTKLFIWPNTYYDRPKHRFPYYDENGTGRLLYGYGGPTLYRYSIFRPLEGYFKQAATEKKTYFEKYENGCYEFYLLLLVIKKISKKEKMKRIHPPKS